MQAVARAPADGLTLLVVPDSPITANPHLFSKLPYDPIKDLTPIIVLCRITPVLVINASLPAQNVGELIAHARANPGKLNYGSYGVGTYAHLSMEDFKQRTGHRHRAHPVSRGGARRRPPLLAGDVSMLILNLSSIEEHEKTGKVRILAAAGEKRAAARPELSASPKPACPALLDHRLVRTVRPAEHGAGAGGPDSRQRQARCWSFRRRASFFQKNSFERVDLAPARVARLMQDNSKHWGALVKAIGAKLD